MYGERRCEAKMSVCVCVIDERKGGGKRRHVDVDIAILLFII